ncbi:MAG: YjjG family noncanonical pyrimidine nucleotidase [Bacteroidota bacterium]
MKSIQHIFFDLDHTLWDYNRSAKETLSEIFDLLELFDSGNTADDFFNVFDEVNNYLWCLYNQGKIDRKHIQRNRFKEILEKLGVNTERSLEASNYFMTHCPSKPYLMPDSMTALRYLSEKYSLHIITNGFQDSQKKKLKSSGVKDFFCQVITSECTGSRKPSREIFNYSLSQAGASLSDSIMIGDNAKTDILGAKNVGMKSVFYDPSGRKKSLADYTIQSHLELIKLF